MPICSNGFHEVQKYLSMTDHLYAPVLLAISTSTWERLSKDQQDVILNSIDEVEEQSQVILEQYTESGLEAIKAAGVEINEVDKEAFVEAIRPLHDALDQQYGGAVEKIKGL